MFRVSDKLMSCSLEKLSGASRVKLPVEFRTKAKTYAECLQRLREVEAECYSYCEHHKHHFLPAADKSILGSNRINLYHDGKNARAEIKVMLVKQFSKEVGNQDYLNETLLALDNILAFTMKHDSDKFIDASLNRILIDEEKEEEQEQRYMK